MKQLIDSILEKLIITKDTKEKAYHDFFVVITESSKVFPELKNKYRNKMLISKPDGWALFVLGKNEVKQLNKDYITHNLLWVYNIPEQYKDNVEKFKDDYVKGTISYFEIKNKNKSHKLSIKDIENLD